MMDQLEMLTAREQLMWDIDGIVEEFACNIAPRISEDDMEDLIKALCDSVCKNFPAKWYKLVSCPTNCLSGTTWPPIRPTLCL